MKHSKTKAGRGGGAYDVEYGKRDEGGGVYLADLYGVLFYQLNMLVITLMEKWYLSTEYANNNSDRGKNKLLRKYHANNNSDRRRNELL